MKKHGTIIFNKIIWIVEKSKNVDVFFSLYRDMIPLPYATKENYKIMLYRLCNTDAEKVCTNLLRIVFVKKKSEKKIFLMKMTAHTMSTFFSCRFSSYFIINVVKL